MDANIAGGQKGVSGKQRDMLNEFGRNLNELVQQGKIDPVIGRDTEIERVIGKPIQVGETIMKLRK